MIDASVFWVVTLCSVVVGCQHFGGPCWLHFHYTTSQSRPLLEYSSQ